MWKIYTDGALSFNGLGACLMLVSPEEKEYTYTLRFEFKTTNTEAEYEALLAGLQIAVDMKVKDLSIFVDSQLVANQVKGLFKARQPMIKQYLDKIKEAIYGRYPTKFMSESTKSHEENSNLIKEIRASMDASVRNQGASIKTLEIQLGKMSKVLQERGFGSLLSSTEANPRNQVKSISTSIEADSSSIRRIGSAQYAISIRPNRTLMYETRQTKILFQSRLNGYYCKEKKGSAVYKLRAVDVQQDPKVVNGKFLLNNRFATALFDSGADKSFVSTNFSTLIDIEPVELDTKYEVELADGKVAIYGRYPSKFMSESTKSHEENSNLIKEIRASMDASVRNQGASIKTLEIQLGKMSKVLQERGFGSLLSYTEANSRNQVKSISTSIEANSSSIRRIGSAQYAISIRPNRTLMVEEEKVVFTSVKPASSLIKRVYMLCLRERMELDLEARLMGETLVLNRSLDLFFEDYIELNDLNEPIELRRNQGDDLMPTIKEGEVIKEFRTRDGDFDTGIDDYSSYCDYDKKIHIDCAHNLKFSCMIGFEFTHANFFPLLYVNVMYKKFHNSIMKDKMVYKGDNIIGALINVPIFVGNFSVVTDFAVLENMDAYRDKGMGDVIVGEPFLTEVRIKTRRFE
nr:reverse transcriptase domain-containing protein [Tanacetum cinerariifolium]